MRVKRSAACVAGLLVLALWIQPLQSAPPSTRPVEGLRGHVPKVDALVGARIVVAPGRVVERGTLVVRDGLIAAAGPDVRVPPDARRWNLEGKTIYPGLIDAYCPTSLASTSTSRGAPYWNALIEPQRHAARHYRVDSGLNESFRGQGITCRLIVPNSGVIKGTSALVTTGTRPAQEALVVPRAALHAHLTVGSADRESTYPTSPMGAFALARQAMIDADWYARAWQAYRTDPGLAPPEHNDALANLEPYLDGRGLVIFDAANEQSFLRADRFAREFALRAVMFGSGREYRRLEAVRASRRGVILPLDFPKPPNVSTPEAARNVSLGALMHWDMAPENPARLAAAGVPIALTAHGLKNPKEFLGAVREAVRRGLEPEDALRALTTEPARWFGVSHRVGTLEAGKAAHLVVADGDLFIEETRVLETWVAGRRHEVVRAPLIDLAGTWQIRVDSRKQALLLELAGEPGKLRGTLRADRADTQKPLKPKLLGLRGARFTCTFDGKPLKAEGMVQLSAVLTREPNGPIDWHGNLHWPDGTKSPIHVKRKENSDSKKTGSNKTDSKKADEEPSDKKPKDAAKPPVHRAASFAVNYPFGAFGRESLPEQAERVAFTNATVWTCGAEGVLEGATVIVEQGKIALVGQNLEVPNGTQVVDCSGKHVTPGIIDSHSHTATNGGVNENGQANSAEVRIADFLDANDIAIYRQLAGGVTTSHVMHGSANPIGGQNQVIKLRWGAPARELIFSEAPASIKFALGENVKQSNRGDDFTTRYPQTRMGVEQFLHDSLEAAAEYGRRHQRWRKNPRGLPPRRDLELDALLEVLEGKSWVHCHAYRQDEIIAALRVLEDFGIQMSTLHHILEGYKVADEMVRHGVMGSAFSDWWAYKFEVYDAIPYNGPLMHRAGVVVAYNSDSRELARHLNLEAAKAMKYGRLPAAEAILLVTRYPAMQLRIDRYVGSLAPGKHADLVVWSGPPLADFSRCEQTWIDGRRYFDRAEDLKRRKEDVRRRGALVQKILSHEQEEKTDKADDKEAEGASI